MEAVLDVYQRPYDPAHPVINLDESPKQLIGHSKIMIAEAKAGKRQVLVKDNHNRITYAKVIQYISEELYPDAKKITLIEDNLSAHKMSALYEILPPDKKDCNQTRIRTSS